MKNGSVVLSSNEFDVYQISTKFSIRSCRITIGSSKYFTIYAICQKYNIWFGLEVLKIFKNVFKTGKSMFLLAYSLPLILYKYFLSTFY